MNGAIRTRAVAALTTRDCAGRNSEGSSSNSSADAAAARRRWTRISRHRQRGRHREGPMMMTATTRRALLANKKPRPRPQPLQDHAERRPGAAPPSIGGASSCRFYFECSGFFGCGSVWHGKRYNARSTMTEPFHPLRFFLLVSCKVGTEEEGRRHQQARTSLASTSSCSRMPTP